MSEWESFYVAEAGASAALAGLLFVAVSINLERILKFPYLPNRALEALGLLVLVLVIASLMLVPGQSKIAIGIELLAIGIPAWAVLTWLDVATLGAARYEKSRTNNVRLFLSASAAATISTVNNEPVHPSRGSRAVPHCQHTVNCASSASPFASSAPALPCSRRRSFSASGSATTGAGTTSRCSRSSAGSSSPACSRVGAPSAGAA